MATSKKSFQRAGSRAGSRKRGFAFAQEGALRILVVTVSHTLPHAIGSVLRELYGIETIVEHDCRAEQALMLLEPNRHTIAFIDENLGTMTGIEMIRAAQARGIATPLVYLADPGSFTEALSAVSEGAVSYLFTNELNLPQLERVIRHALSAPAGRTLRLARSGNARASIASLSAELESDEGFAGEQVQAGLPARTSTVTPLKTAFTPRTLKLVLDRLPLGVFWRNHEGVYLGCNQTFARLHGQLSCDDIVGKNDTDLGYSDAERAGRNSRIERVLRMGASENEKVVVRTAGGGASTYSVQIVPLRDEKGDVLGVLGVYSSCPSEQEGESIGLPQDGALRYRVLAEESPVGIWQVDVEGFTTYINPAMCGMLEVASVPELLSQSNRSFLSPEALERINRIVESREEAKSVTFEAELIGAKGRRLQVMVTNIPIIGPSGRLESVLSVCLDISAQKRAVDEHLKLQVQMLHAQKLESLGVLAGGIAHDFNNLLIGILGNAGLAAMELVNDSPAAYRVEQVKRAAERASDLTNQLLAYSGRGTVSKQLVNLSSVVDEMCRLLETVVSKKAMLRFDLMIDLPPCDADPTQLRQVVMNLITNASEAIGDHEGVITVHTGVMYCNESYFTDGIPEVRLPEGWYSYIEVSDTGEGLDDSQLNRVFDPFFTTKSSGRGLGLAAVLGIVRAHGGSIKARSSRGVGTAFRVLLPAQPGTGVVRIHSPGDALREWRGKGTVLVVDDEPVVQEVARGILERYGFDVLSAGDGRAAIELYRRFQNNVVAIVLDLTMPVMDGDEAFARLRSIRDDVPVILSSGYTQPASVGRLLRGERTTFIQKPYRPVRLVETLRQVLSA